jgi:hypothetical protein
MGYFGIFGWGFILQALAIIHFIRRRPDFYWLFIIIFLGPLGAVIYLLVEALPDLRSGGSFNYVSRKRRVNEMRVTVSQNPSAGNYEELGDALLQDGQYADARDAYNRAISARTDHPDPFYRRALCFIELGDFAAAVPDLERVVGADPNYDIHRAAGLLAYCYGHVGQTDKAAALFERVTQISTLTETQYHYAEFLAAQGRTAEARDWAQRILAKRAATPGIARRRERPWFRKTIALLHRLPA